MTGHLQSTGVSPVGNEHHCRERADSPVRFGSFIERFTGVSCNGGDCQFLGCVSTRALDSGSQLVSSSLTTLFQNFHGLVSASKEEEDLSPGAVEGCFESSPLIELRDDSYVVVAITS